MSHPKQLMLQHFTLIIPPGPDLLMRIEVLVSSTEPCMAMAVNVRPKRIHLKELTERTAPDLCVPQPRIENTKGWTVGHKDCRRVKRRRQTSKVDLDVGVGLFKCAAHERQ